MTPEKVLAWITWRRAFEYTVTLQEIADHFALSRRHILTVVRWLEAFGLVTWEAGKTGTIMPTQRIALSPVSLPVVRA